jgi:NADH-quinone oxidoreductase subunit M
VAVSSLGVILAAGYVLWMVKRVFYGEVTNPKNLGLPDLSLREATVLVPLVVLAIVMGVASPAFTRRIEPSADALVRQVKERTQPVRAADIALPAGVPHVAGEAEGVRP